MSKENKEQMIQIEGDEAVILGESRIERERLRSVITSAREKDVNMSLADLYALGSGDNPELQQQLGITPEEALPVSNYLRVRFGATMAQYDPDPSVLARYKEQLNLVEGDE